MMSVKASLTVNEDQHIFKLGPQFFFFLTNKFFLIILYFVIVHKQKTVLDQANFLGSVLNYKTFIFK